MKFHWFSLSFCAVLTPALSAQESIRLVEMQALGTQYHVSCRVEISGTLPIPSEKEKGNKKMLKVDGKSTIEYDERLLKTNTQKQIERTVRWYDRLDFERRVGEETQQNSLRPEVRRLVILRHKQFEVPFSPSGPLTWGEIDLVRTDVFTPALNGLLPRQAVRPGERWQAETEAVQELTDLEKITNGTITCTLENLVTGRKQARISFEGEITGITEDGNAKHKIVGTLYFDLQAQIMSYLSLTGSRYLLDKNGQIMGQIDGNFTLTREARPRTHYVSDDAVRGSTLEPNQDNTQLLFEDAKMGLRFLYPRNWHVAGSDDKERRVGVDNDRGSGFLIVVEPRLNPNLMSDFQTGILEGLKQQKATVKNVSKAENLQPGLSSFRVEAMVGTDRNILQYYIVQQKLGAATVTARVQARDHINALREMEQIVRSVVLSSAK